MTPNIQTHQERNVDLATFLKAAGVPIVQVDTNNPHDLVWHFAQPERCQELVRQFYQGTARVNPQTILLEAKRLKDQIFEARRRNGRSGGCRNGGNKH